MISFIGTSGIGKLVKPFGYYVFTEKLERALRFFRKREQLKQHPFSECTARCLVNLAYVTRVGKDSISPGRELLSMSRRIKKEFTVQYISYVNGE